MAIKIGEDASYVLEVALLRPSKAKICPKIITRESLRELLGIAIEPVSTMSLVLPKHPPVNAAGARVTMDHNFCRPRVGGYAQGGK